MAESSEARKFCLATGSVSCGVFSAVRSLPMVSRMFWVWWVSTLTANESPAFGAPDSSKLTPAAVAVSTVRPAQRTRCHRAAVSSDRCGVQLEGAAAGELEHRATARESGLVGSLIGDGRARHLLGGGIARAAGAGNLIGRRNSG